MADIMQNWRTSRILAEAAVFRTLYSIYKKDPSIGPNTAATLGDPFRSYRDDAKALHDFEADGDHEQ
jgi:hypothetical protein